MIYNYLTTLPMIMAKETEIERMKCYKNLGLIIDEVNRVNQIPDNIRKSQDLPQFKCLL